MSSGSSPFPPDYEPVSPAPAPQTDVPQPRSRAPAVVAAGCICFLLLVLFGSAAVGIGVLVVANTQLNAEVATAKRELESLQQEHKITRDKLADEAARAKHRAANPQIVVDKTQVKELNRQINVLQSELDNARRASMQSESRLRTLGIDPNTQAQISDEGLTADAVPRLIASSSDEVRTVVTKWILKQEADDLLTEERQAILNAIFSRYGLTSTDNLALTKASKHLLTRELTPFLIEQLQRNDRARPLLLQLLAEQNDPRATPAIVGLLNDSAVGSAAKQVLMKAEPQDSPAIREQLFASRSSENVVDVLAAWKMDVHAIVIEEAERRIEKGDKRLIFLHPGLLRAVPDEEKYADGMCRVIAALLTDLVRQPTMYDLVERWADASLWEIILKSEDNALLSRSSQAIVPMLVKDDGAASTKLLYAVATSGSSDEQALEELAARGETMQALALADLNASDSRKRNAAVDLLRASDAPDVELAKQCVVDLRGPVKSKQSSAMKTLTGLEVDPKVQNDVIDALDKLTDITSSSLPGDLVTCWQRWLSPEREDVALRLCDAKQFGLNEAGFRALVEGKSDKLKEVTTRVFDRSSRHKGFVDALIRTDAEVEDLALFLLSSVNSSYGKAAACQVLAARGTAKSLPQLQAFVDLEKTSNTAKLAASYAIKAIETRTKKQSS